MGRGYRRSSSSRGRARYSRSTPVGVERAMEHIKQAKALSYELGGTDADVKHYFFSLPDRQIATLLDAYGKQHGTAAREYALTTLPKWRSGRVHMSGLVAERLFNLLPPRMPLTEKYKLTQGLWEHFGPQSKKRLRIGTDADIEGIVQAVQNHFDEVVEHHKIPDQMERRFNWLAAGDVGVKQQLLNQLRSQERALLSQGARLQLPVMIDHLRADVSELTSRMSQMLKIGKHELELLIDRQATGFQFEEWTPPAPVRIGPSPVTAFFGNGVVMWIMVVGGIAMLAKCAH